MQGVGMGLATLIVINGKVLTMDDAQPRAEAVALNGERILAVGASAEIAAMASAAQSPMQPSSKAPSDSP